MLNRQIINYLRDVKLFTGDDKEIVSQLVNNNKINHNNYSLFSSGDTGVKRCKFLLIKLDEWKNLPEAVVFDRIINLYKSKKNPPEGLGNSVALRIYIAKFLFAFLGFRNTIDEINAERERWVIINQNGASNVTPGAVVIYAPPSDEIILSSLTMQKVENYIKNIGKPLSNMGKLDEIVRILHRLNLYSPEPLDVKSEVDVKDPEALLETLQGLKVRLELLQNISEINRTARFETANNILDKAILKLSLRIKGSVHLRLM